MSELDAAAAALGPDPAIPDDQFWTDGCSVIVLGPVTSNGVDDMQLGGHGVTELRWAMPMAQGAPASPWPTRTTAWTTTS